MPKNRPNSRSSKEQRAVDAANRLTARDRDVLLAIYEHKVLLTEHLTTLFFRSLRRAQDRLRELAYLDLIERWHPPQERGKGKSPGYWFLRDPGARIVAAMKGVARSQLPWMPRERLVNDKHLPHRIGVHSFFCTLVEASLGGWCQTGPPGHLPDHDQTLSRDRRKVAHLTCCRGLNRRGKDTCFGQATAGTHPPLSIWCTCSTARRARLTAAARSFQS